MLNATTSALLICASEHFDSCKWRFVKAQGEKLNRGLYLLRKLISQVTEILHEFILLLILESVLSVFS